MRKLESKHDSKIRRARGFSMCEVLVASAVMAVSLLGLAQLLGLALMQNHFARYNATAIELGKGKVEELKDLYIRELLTGTAQADLTDGDHGPQTITLSNGVDAYGDQLLSVRWTVTSVGAVRKNLEVSVVPQGMNTPDVRQPVLSRPITLETVLLP